MYKLSYPILNTYIKVSAILLDTSSLKKVPLSDGASPSPHKGHYRKYLSYFRHSIENFFNSGLWGLVNNAGVASTGPIEWIPMEKFKRTADINLWGLIDVTKTFLPLIKNARGRVVNISSMLGKWYRVFEITCMTCD